MKFKRVTYYDPKEEKLNVISHGLGLVLSIIALIVLVVYSSKYGSNWHIISFSIYGASLILLYSASTFYHYVQNPKWRHWLFIYSTTVRNIDI